MERVPEVAGVLPLQDDSRDRARAARRSGPSSAASTPIPPARANENGMNPASRRDCDRETTSENGVKSHGTSVIAKTASEPPTT